MTDDLPNPTTPDAMPAGGFDGGPRGDADAVAGADPPSTAGTPTGAERRAHRPEYKGSELDPDRGPGLGCFWFQVFVLAFFVILIPIGINLAWPFELLAFLLFVVIGLLLLTGQTVIFLLRLVAADRRAQGRRRPLASTTKTVGELEDQHRVAHAVGGARPASSASVAGPAPAGAADGPLADQVPALEGDVPPGSAEVADDPASAPVSPGVDDGATDDSDDPGPDPAAAPAADAARGPGAVDQPGEPDPGMRQ